MPLLFGIHTQLPKLNILKKVLYCAARFVKNDHRRQTVTIYLMTTLGWPTLEGRMIIKQSMTFYEILNNVINITPLTGLLKPQIKRSYYVATRCRINTAVVSFLVQINSHLEYDPITHY